MDYDVLILGGGIIGCAVAYELSKYNINIALIEKDYDIANDISFANTAIIYDGAESDDDEMAKLEIEGSKLIEKHCQKFNISYNKVGALRITSNEARNAIFDKIYKRAKERGINGISIVEGDKVYSIEPNLKVNTNKIIYSESIAIISPYNLAVSYAEVAADNGVNFRLEEEVIDIKSISKGFKVTTNKNKFTCKFVINTIPNELSSGKCCETKCEMEGNRIKYILLNENLENNVGTIVINDIDEDIFTINMPTSFKGNLIGIKSDNNCLSLDEELALAKNVLKHIDMELITNVFTESYNKNNIFLDDGDIEEGYIKIKGNHYAQVTIAPAIAKEIEKRLKVNMNMTQKRDYIDKKREVYAFKDMSNEQRNKIIAVDNRYGNIICSCNNVSEGEVIDCIRRPLGARTIEGVKRRTGIGLGSCNGSYCNIKIMKILAREMDKSILDIVDDSMDSNVLLGRIKEFNEI